MHSVWCCDVVCLFLWTFFSPHSDFYTTLFSFNSLLFFFFALFRYARGAHVERDQEKYHGGLIDMLCDTTLNDQQRSVVIDAIHNFCYGKDGESNKSEIIQHYYRILRKILFQCSEKDHDLVLRRSANTLLCLLNIRADHDAADADDDH